MNLWTIFLTGLFTGGLTCLAVQGGLLATTIAQREEEKLKEKVKGGNALPILVFLIAKLVAYTGLGLLLGWFGSLFAFSLTIRVILQFAVGAFMVGTALNILKVHPIFRYFAIQPPKFLTRMIRRQSKSSNLLAPATLGAFTVLIPCGTTQAMMALAIASGNPVLGAAIMFVFVLGTSPVFFTLGYFATKLGDIMQERFMKLAGFAIILLAIFNINNALALTGSNYTIENTWNGFVCTISFCRDAATGQQVVAVNDNPEIEIADSGYKPDNITIKAGSQITLHLKNTGGRGCTQTFTIPKLGIQKSVPIGNSDTISFTAPTTSGELAFMCSMGMYRGAFTVI